MILNVDLLMQGLQLKVLNYDMGFRSPQGFKLLKDYAQATVVSDVMSSLQQTICTTARAAKAALRIAVA